MTPTRRHRRWWHESSALVLASIAFASAEAQAPAKAIFAIGGGTPSLNVVVAAAITDSGVVVLSSPTPALLLRRSNGVVHTWGRQGAGPGELLDPADVAWGLLGGVVLDTRQRRLTAYTNIGQTAWSRSLATEWANRVAFVGGDTLLQLFVPMTTRHTIVRLARRGVDTILSYDRSSKENQVVLAPPGATSLTVTKPFSSATYWSPVGSKGIAVWFADQRFVTMLDLSGKELARIPLPSDAFTVTALDREWWFNEAIPQEFMGKRVFEPVRLLARKQITFPRVFPVVTGLIGDPAGAVWIRRTSTAGGEVWQRLGTPSTRPAGLHLPPGRALLALGRTVAITKTTDDASGEPIVEGYSLPR